MPCFCNPVYVGYTVNKKGVKISLAEIKEFVNLAAHQKSNPEFSGCSIRCCVEKFLIQKEILERTL